MAVTWIITDVDGCISPEESVPWDLDLFWQLARLTRQASEGLSPVAPMTLCTGRPQPYAEVLMKLLDVRAPAVCENGVVLYSLHDNRSRYGPGVTLEKIRALREVRTFIETDVLPQEPRAVLQFGKEAQLSIYCAQPEVLPSVRRRIEQFLGEHGGPALHITASHYYLNLSLAGVDKGSTLRLLLSELGVTQQDVAGIGDTEGDLALRETVGFFACPANATPSIQRVADYISPHPALRGVLDILNHPQMRRTGFL